MAPSSFLVTPGACLSGRLTIPGDKSISHRALMLAAVAQGKTRIDGFLPSKDNQATLRAFQKMGVSITHIAETEVLIEGVGLHGLKAYAGVIDLGNSGTAARLLAGLLSGQSFSSRLTGDASLCRRPMSRIIEPLRQMGATINGIQEDRLPLSIDPVAGLHGIEYRLPVASAQVKSALLLAALYASGKTCITEPNTTRDHTERMLTLFSHPVSRQGQRICLSQAKRLLATTIYIPGDLSSAAFFIVGACIAPQSRLLLSNIGFNPTRNAVIEILKMMGGNIEVRNHRTVSNEPIADIEVGTSTLHGITIPKALVPSAIDEFPAIMIAAAYASGKTILTGAAELRTKESDRIQTMADGLQATGIAVKTAEDGITIYGGQMQGGNVDSRADHRIAMAFAIAGIRAKAPIYISNCENVDTSFPGFAKHAIAVGLNLHTNI